MQEHGVEPYETRTEAYGWLITAGRPIKYEGRTVAYAYADLSMDAVEAVINSYSSAGVMAIIVCLVVVCLAGVLMMNEFVVNPIKKLTEVASQYKIETNEIGGLESSAFRDLDIKTGDEIEVLASSMKKLESDLNDQIENLFATRQELISTREHADIMSEIANRDALTGIRNKRGYETEIQRINKGIAMGNTKVGVVMVDMNDLKEVNDKYGHEKGDKVICSLCDMLCSVFKRSPVFRIGGDEFVVVVSNYDYANLESNVAKFKKSVDHNVHESELEPWERASAAIGYAIFEEDKDIAIEDTLKRADEKMYACKQEMKAKYKREKEEDT
jgi:diguanylate cyclase (GGDEF)-like protein